MNAEVTSSTKKNQTTGADKKLKILGFLSLILMLGGWIFSDHVDVFSLSAGAFIVEIGEWIVLFVLAMSALEEILDKVSEYADGKFENLNNRLNNSEYGNKIKWVIAIIIVVAVGNAAYHFWRVQ